jgi:hypothetical protein
MEAAAEENAEETIVASVTSTGAVEMVEEGKSVCKDCMAWAEDCKVEGKSKR